MDLMEAGGCKIMFQINGSALRIKLAILDVLHVKHL